MGKQTFSLDFFGRNLTVETGEIAKQAGGSVLVRYEDTVVFSAATASKEAKDQDFFPLTVSFEEKMYAAGKIPGGFLRREGRPTEHATLTARMIDRPIRPLFAEGFRNDVQVVNTALACNYDYSVEMTAMFGASLALCISDIPFNGPIAGVKVGRVNGEFVINPTQEQAKQSDIDLTVAGTKVAINMVECGAKEVSEDDMVDALMFGHEAIKKLCAFEEEITAKCGKPKMEVKLYEVPAELREKINAFAKERIEKAVSIQGKLERYNAIDEITAETVEYISGMEYENDKAKEKAVKMTKEVCTEIEAGEVRRLIVEDKVRPDGRKVDEIRPLNAQVDILPRVHGSALFTRGETQVLAVTTLSSLSDNQIIEDLTPRTEKRWMHHYNFPPYCVGETGRMGTPGRREIGHGALGEKALAQVLPDEETFPYCIRTVAEVMESNGSSSQASICASCMSLMAAGVPIKAPVAGIAMGLIETEKGYTILTDIQGMEDHFGDMDFKVAGTRNGICALQMDIKIDGVSREILSEALAQAHKARFQILDVMEATIDKPRDHVAETAPKFRVIYINPEKIRDVIGTGGKVINKIIEECNNVSIDIDEDNSGRIFIYHQDQAMVDKAVGQIEAITKEAKVGEIYDATVVRLESYGAFVNLFEGTDALLHVSKIDYKRIENPADVLKIGDKIKVKVTGIDEKGRVDVSHKELLEKPEGYEERPKKTFNRRNDRKKETSKQS